MGYDEIYNTEDKILIVGTYPPPIGGVSIHIKRLISWLSKKGIKNEVFDSSKKSKIPLGAFIRFLWVLQWNSFDVLHLHQFDVKKVLAILFIKKIKKFKLYFTDHNPRIFVGAGRIRVFVLKIFIRNLDVLIMVNKHVQQNYLEKGMSFPEKTFVINAFLPPNLEEENLIFQSYKHNDTTSLLKHKPIVLGNAFQLNFFEGVDLYGLDMCVELTKKLVLEFPNIGFGFLLANRDKNSAYLKSIIQKIYTYGIADNFYLISENEEMWPIIKKSDLMVRPTNTDGDAISIREALYFNVPVIASDVCERPKQVILFKSRDMVDFYNKTVDLLNKIK